MTTQRNVYDHRFRELVCSNGDVELAVQLGVNRSTAKSWLRRGQREVVSNELFDGDSQQLRVRVLRLEQRLQVLLTIIRLPLLLVRLAGARLDGKRLPEGENKRLVVRASQVVPTEVALRTIGLSAGRYQDWCPTRVCELDDRTSCPKSRPTQLSPDEEPRRGGASSSSVSRRGSSALVFGFGTMAERNLLAEPSTPE